MGMNKKADFLFGENVNKTEAAELNRNKAIVKTGTVGIIGNLLLSISKGIIGLLTNSIAILLDAVNNITDVASSVITIIGTKLASKQPDKKHPFGHGRLEYLSAMIISILVLYAGLSSIIESVKKIIHPEETTYTTPFLLIIAVAVFVKIFLGFYSISQGKKFNSVSLINSGKDALLDSIISASTLISALVFIFWNISLDSWLGAVISLVVIRAGLEMLIETVSALLGERVDPALAGKIKRTILKFPDVKGAYDLVLNNYGPDSYNGSVHIEIPDTYTADRIDELVRKIQIAVYNEYKVILTAIGVYSYNTTDKEAAKIRNEIYTASLKHPHVLQVHGFYMNREEKTLRFDVVISFDSPERHAEFDAIVSEVQEMYPEYEIIAAIDADYSEMDS